jgi:leucyl/phenylalanyl-tRNA--protein transferase
LIVSLNKYNYTFPNPRYASNEGLLAYGGDLNPNRVLEAYRKGIFPWFSQDDPIMWWSPNPRLLIYPDSFKVSKSFRRILRNNKFEVKFDNDFLSTISHCRNIKRKNENGTWITDDIIDTYLKLHNMGFAHSVEVYRDNILIGGLYGLSMGKAFFGESMFSLDKNGSKIALKALRDILYLNGYDFIDCQLPTNHLISMGGEIVERDIFLDELEDTLKKTSNIGSWSGYIWKNIEY